MLVRCPAHLAFAVPPDSANPLPDFVPDEQWRSPSFLASSDDKSEKDKTQDVDLNARTAQEFRLALVLLHEKSLGVSSPWAPYLNHLPVRYDLLSSWSDNELDALRDCDLAEKARAQREENISAFECVAACPENFSCSKLTYDEITWGLDTVRSRSFLGEYPETPDANTPHPKYPSGNLKGDADTSGSKTKTPATFVLPLLDAFNHLSHRRGATKLVFEKASNSFSLKAESCYHLGDEATISYGTRTNAELLLRFGFCVFESIDETVSLPGCMDELEWLMPGSARERDLYQEGLHHAVRDAKLDCVGRANANLLWALRVLLASDEDYDAVGGAKGFRVAFPSGLDGRDVKGSGAQLAAEASLALACAREFDNLGGGTSLAEDETQLEAASVVLREVESECALCQFDENAAGYEGAGDSYGPTDQPTDTNYGDQNSCDPDLFTKCVDSGDEGDDLNYLRRLVMALEFRVGRKRILAAAMSRYSPLKEALTRSGQELYASGMEGGDYDEKVG